MKRHAKAATKKRIKIWLWATIVSFLLNIILPLVLVATMFIPFSFCYQMLGKIGDVLVDGTLQLKAKTWDTWINWLSVEGDNGEQYEDYLISTFKRIDKELYNAKKKEAEGKLDDDFNENDLYDKSAAAIGWVYSRIYSATMEPSWSDKWFDFGKSMFTDAITTKTQGKVLKPLEDTVVELYDPASKEADLMDVAKLREKSFNEIITPYDIQAFDYVAGTLFELLNFDIEELRESIGYKHQEDIENKYNEATEDIYKDAIKEFLYLNRQLVDEAFKNDNKTGDDSANQYLKKTDNPYRFTFSDTDAGVTWQLLSYIKLSNKSQQDIIDKAWKVADKIYMVDEKKTVDKIYALDITKDDYDALISIAPYMKDILFNYIDNTKELSSREKDDIKDLVGNIHDTKNIAIWAWNWGVYPKQINVLKTDTNEKIAVKEVDINKELTDDEFDALLRKKIKELRLDRTWKVGETFRDALLELDDSGQIAEYYSLSFGDADDESSLAYKLTHLTSPLIIGNDRYNAFTKVPMFGQLTSALTAMGVGPDSNYKFDANDNLILAGLSGGKNYLSNEVPEVVEKMIAYMKQHKDNVETKVNEKVEELKKSSNERYNEDSAKAKERINSAYATISQFSSTLKSSGKFDEIYRNANNGTLTTSLIESGSSGFNSNTEVSNLTNAQLQAVTKFYKEANDLVSAKETMTQDIAKIENSGSETIEYINEQIQSILNDLDKIPTEGEYYKNTTYFVKSDISEVTQGGYTRELKSIGSEKNILKIQKYKNTLKEAVMITAQKCYPEKVRELSGQSGGFTGTIQLDDIEIGSEIDSGAYQNAYKYIDYFIKYGNMFGVDPYLLLAKAATESSGNHEINLNPDAGYGLMQIERPGLDTTGVTAYNHETKQNEYVAVSGPDSVKNVEDNIKVGAMMYANSVKQANYNILLSIQGYNYGIGTAKVAVRLYAEEIGKTMEEVILDYSDIGWRKYLMAIHLDINGVTNPDTPWTLNEKNHCTQTRCEEPGGTGHYGNPYYINDVLRFYNPVDSGGPWVLTEDGEKIQITSGGTISGGSSEDSSSNNGESTNDTAKYFKGKELINWKDYYTDTKVFEEVDKWYLSDLDTSSEDKLETSLSQTIINAIQKYVTSPQVIKETNGLLNDSGVLGNLIAKTYYVATGFKPVEPTQSGIEKDIKTIGDSYISAIKEIASISGEGIDLSFAIYLNQFSLGGREIGKQEILLGNKDFDKFIQDNYLKDKESLTAADTVLTQVVRIITGDRNAKVDSYFSISSEKEESTSTGKIVDGRLMFYKQWLDAKNTFHETFNAEIDEQIENFKENGPSIFSPITSVEQMEAMKLPVDFTFDGAVADNTDSYIKDGLMGKLSLTLKGDTVVDELMMFKQDLTNTNNFSTTKNEPMYIVLHEAEDTSGGASAKKQYDVYNGDRGSETHKSVHFTVDNSSIYQWLPEETSAYHIKSSNGEVTNSNSIAIEYVATNGKVSEQLQWNLVALYKYLIHKYPSVKFKIVLHSAIEDIECPDILGDTSSIAYDEFTNKLTKEGLVFKFEEVTQYSGDAKKLIEEAMKHLGKPYVWGGKGPNGFDCSGFVQYVFATALGKSVPAPTWTQMTLGVEVQRADLKPGDLIFFRGGDHVAIYIGEYEGVDSYIHSGGPTSGPNPTAQDKVMIYPMTRDTMTSFRRIL